MCLGGVREGAEVMSRPGARELEKDQETEFLLTTPISQARGSLN